VANKMTEKQKMMAVGGVALGELFQFNTAVPGDPRTYMVNVRFNF